MKDYKSLTCLEIKEILKKHNVTGYSKLCKQELVNLVKKKIKKGGNSTVNQYSILQQTNNKNGQKKLFNSEAKTIMNSISNKDKSGKLLEILQKMIKLNTGSDEYEQLNNELAKIIPTNNNELINLIDNLLLKHSNSEERLI
jgi:acetylglutamate synthase